MARGQDIVIWNEDGTQSTDVINSQAKTFDALNSDYIHDNITVGLTAVEVKVGVSRLANRKAISIHNNSNKTIYRGGSGVTISNGIPMPSGTFIIFSVGDIPVYLIADTAGLDVRIEEWA